MLYILLYTNSLHWDSITLVTSQIHTKGAFYLEPPNDTEAEKMALLSAFEIA